jgi:hypothetical protein
VIGSYRNRPVCASTRFNGMAPARVSKRLPLGTRARARPASGRHLTMHTPNRNERALPGDWIVKAPNGEFSIVKAEEFAQTYEPIPD